MIPFQDATVPLDAVDGPSDPLREAVDPESLGDLADDMAVNGLLQPIGLRGPSPAGRYEVVWGDRRLRAARLLGWTTVNARVCPWPTDPALARIAENLLRADLNPREEARAIRAFRGQGMPIAQVARVMRRSVAWVEARLELLEWPEELQDRVVSGALSFAAARLLARIDYEPYRETLIAEAERTGASAPVISVWLAHYEADRDRIVRNAEAVEQIVTRRESFRVVFTCEACFEEGDTKESVLLRVHDRCARALRAQKLTQRDEAAHDGGQHRQVH